MNIIKTYNLTPYNLILCITLCMLQPIYSQEISYRKIRAKLVRKKETQEDIAKYTKGRIIARLKKRILSANPPAYVPFFGLKIQDDGTITTKRPVLDEKENGKKHNTHEKIYTYTCFLQSKLIEWGLPLAQEDRYPETPGTQELYPKTSAITCSPYTEELHTIMKKLHPKTLQKAPYYYKALSNYKLCILAGILHQIALYIKTVKELYPCVTTKKNIAQFLPNVMYETKHQNKIFQKKKHALGYTFNSKNIYIKRKKKRTPLSIVEMLTTIEHEITHFEQHLNNCANTRRKKTMGLYQLPDDVAEELDAEIESIRNYPNQKHLNEILKSQIGEDRESLPYLPPSLAYTITANTAKNEEFGLDDTEMQQILEVKKYYLQWSINQKSRQTYHEEKAYYQEAEPIESAFENHIHKLFL